MKYLNRSKLKLSFLLLLSSIAASCADAGDPDGESTDNGGGETYSSMDQYLTELADDYLFKQATADEKAILLENIRSLTPEDTRLFHRITIERAGLTGNERRGAEIAAAYAEENGISLLNARREKHEEAISARLRAELTQSEGPALESGEKGACGFGQVPCNFVTFWNSSLANGTCTTGCVNGTLYDRTGNEACEYGACDYRIRFTKAPATQIDGNTLAADCVLAYYGALLSYTGAPYTYAVIGQGGIVACFLPTGSIHTLFKVW